MIPSGLKVGDTFFDCDRYFEVVEVVPEGYVSKMVDKPVEKPVEEKEVAEEKPATRGRKKS